eukprot:Unigene15598_Nuclearia_a/m.46536 Unigene15598_Nuclearia_a/g.46536  ORF Unigene15598_Nuclearia_a/g.46536 Unigene15598_Nuclearia_a/m.46536 type:complete len:362 (-) Unigene15598_Nuclearia_a:520-1605(-)
MNTTMLWRRVVGTVFSFSAFFSVFAGYFLLVFPAKVVLLLAPRRFRSVMDGLAAWWMHFPVGFFAVVGGVRYHFHGDVRALADDCLALCNHRTYFDWVFAWALFGRFGRPHNLRIVLKHGLRYVPVAGWLMQLLRFIFLHRDWERDRVILDHMLGSYVRGRYPLQLLFFPEGTNLDAPGRASSERFAIKSGLPVYRHTMHPRATGFVHAVHALRGHLDSVLDITVAYGGYVPEDRDSFLRGRYANDVHFHVRRYRISELPKDDAQLGEWLRERWADKEAMLHRFYDGPPHARGTLPDLVPAPPMDTFYKVNVLSWLAVMLLVAALLQFNWFRWYLLTVSVANVVIDYMVGYEEVTLTLVGV